MEFSPQYFFFINNTCPFATVTCQNVICEKRLTVTCYQHVVPRLEWSRHIHTACFQSLWLVIFSPADVPLGPDGNYKRSPNSVDTRCFDTPLFQSGAGIDDWLLMLFIWYEQRRMEVQWWRAMTVCVWSESIQYLCIAVVTQLTTCEHGFMLKSQPWCFLPPITIFDNLFWMGKIWCLLVLQCSINQLRSGVGVPGTPSPSSRLQGDRKKKSEEIKKVWANTCGRTTLLNWRVSVLHQARNALIFC